MQIRQWKSPAAAAIALFSIFYLGNAHSQSWEFTNCNTQGRLGPNQANCNAAYSGTSLQGAVTVTNGIQAWTVPASGTYLIEADGAAGGTQQYPLDGGPFPGGLGASMQGQFNLTAGETLYILVGQMGGDTRADDGTGDDWESAAPGGGGGTFVFRNANDAFPLIAAGGGGSGTSCDSIAESVQNANTGPNGDSAQEVDPDNGGTGGNGGLRNNEVTSYWAGGGAGWLTDGTGGNNATNNNFSPGYEGGEGGRAPRNGGAGGLRWIDNLDEGGDGGFGGGGGGGSDNMGGGGGGGFSGGGGANGDSCEVNGGNSNNPGGGGGSYNGGANQANGLAASRDHGKVTIRAVEATPQQAAVPVPALSPAAMIALFAMLGFVALTSLRRQKTRV